MTSSVLTDNNFVTRVWVLFYWGNLGHCTASKTDAKNTTGVKTVVPSRFTWRRETQPAFETPHITCRVVLWVMCDATWQCRRMWYLTTSPWGPRISFILALRKYCHNSVYGIDWPDLQWNIRTELAKPRYAIIRGVSGSPYYHYMPDRSSPMQTNQQNSRISYGGEFKHSKHILLTFVNPQINCARNTYIHTYIHTYIRGCNQKFPDWVDEEIYAYNNKHSRTNTKGYGGKTHKIAIQLHLVAESCTICSSRSRRPVR
jgi:hypothetical protein